MNKNTNDAICTLETMNISKIMAELKKIHAKNISYEFVGSLLRIDLPLIVIDVEVMPDYMDRGRYRLWIKHKPEASAIITIDAQDMFPRYFFKLENLFDEFNEWLKKRESELRKH